MANNILRKTAISWWNKLLYIEQWENIVQCKTLIIGYPDRSPESLTGREIESIYKKLNQPP